MATKFGFDYSQFSDLLKSLDQVDGRLKQGIDKALVDTKRNITPHLEQAMSKHRRTGRTAGSLDKSYTVDWSGNVASIDIGFHIRQGGLPSIFLMYGTPRHAPSNGYTPRDTNLYNAIYGRAAKAKIKEAQEEALRSVLNGG